MLDLSVCFVTFVVVIFGEISVHIRMLIVAVVDFLYFLRVLLSSFWSPIMYNVIYSFIHCRFIHSLSVIHSLPRFFFSINNSFLFVLFFVYSLFYFIIPHPMDSPTYCNSITFQSNRRALTSSDDNSIYVILIHPMHHLKIVEIMKKIR
jgi:hypothetical protein